MEYNEKKFEVFIGDYEKFNEDEPTGVWIELPASNAEYMAALDKLGLKDRPEASFVPCFEDPFSTDLSLPGDLQLDELETFDEFNSVAIGLSKLEEPEVATTLLYERIAPTAESAIANLLSKADNSIGIRSDILTLKDVGEYWVDGLCGLKELSPDTIRDFTDYKKLGTVLAGGASLSSEELCRIGEKYAKDCIDIPDFMEDCFDYEAFGQAMLDNSYSEVLTGSGLLVNVDSFNPDLKIEDVIDLSQELSDLGFEVDNSRGLAK